MKTWVIDIIKRFTFINCALFILIVPVTTLPKFNDKRRSILPFTNRFSSGSKLDDENDDNASSFNDTEIVNASGNYNGSMQSLTVPQGKSNPRPRSQFPDSQSLKNFPNPTSPTNTSQLNTWSSQGDVIILIWWLTSSYIVILHATTLFVRYINFSTFIIQV